MRASEDRPGSFGLPAFFGGDSGSGQPLDLRGDPTIMSHVSDRGSP